MNLHSSNKSGEWLTKKRLANKQHPQKHLIRVKEATFCASKQHSLKRRVVL
jgi:hypothetical protein